MTAVQNQIIHGIHLGVGTLNKRAHQCHYLNDLVPDPEIRPLSQEEPKQLLNNKPNN
jgi:hypothetical protein